MRSKWITIALLVSACSVGIGNDPDPSNEPGVIGQKLEDITPLFNGYGIASKTLFLVDEPTQRILEIDLEQYKVINALTLLKPENPHTLVSSYTGLYVLDFSTKHLQIIRAGGSRDDRPFPFQGTPVAAAFNPVKGILAMHDDLQSIGLLMLSEIGVVIKSWLGGPLIDKGKSLLAGDIDSSGRLLLAVSDQTIATVDVEGSVDAGAWKFESFATDIPDIRWLAPDSQQADKSLLLAKDAIGVADVLAKAVSEKIVLSEKKLVVIGSSKMIKPHVVTRNTQNDREEIHYISSEGKLVSQELPRRANGGYSVSYLSANAAELVILVSEGDAHRVTRWRLSDNLVVLDETVRSQGDVQLGPDILIVNKKSSLGYLQVHNLSDSSVREIKGYNFDHFSRQGN